MTPLEPASAEGGDPRDLLAALADPLEPVDRGPIPAAHVVAVVVVHDGERWIRGCLNALNGQTRPADVVVVVDVASIDGAPGLIDQARELGGVDVVVAVPRDTGFGAAVAAGLAAAGPAEDLGWVWLLHDDCAPEPPALEELLRAGATSSGAGILGPKCVDWHDPQILLEVGWTVDRAGHRITGLEPRELDQGQLDGQRVTLAVGTAGALVRRVTWDAAGGMDPALPIFRDDLDLCWKAAALGHRVEVVPAAVVRHARAASTGRRALASVEGPPRRADRRHALWVLLANAGTLGLAVRTPVLVVSCLLRALGDLLTRRPQHARDELGAVWHVLRCLPRLLGVAADRDRRRKVPARDVRRLLAPRGASVRNRLGQAGDLLAAGPDEPITARGLETGPSEEDEAIPTDDGRRLARLVLRPSLLLPVVIMLVTLWAAHSLLGGGTLVGGRLLPAPQGASDLWHRWWTTWTSGPSGGSSTPAPPWTPVLALLSTITLGRPSLAIDLILLGAPAMAALSAWHASRHLVTGRALRTWGAALWALSPVATGVVAGGRFDVAVVLVTLPWLLTAGTRLLLGHGRPGQGSRRPWWVGLVLALTAAFSPPTLLALVGLGLLLVLVGSAFGQVPLHRAGGLLIVVTAVPVVLGLPWVGEALRHPRQVLVGLGQVQGSGMLPARAVASPAHQLLLVPGGAGMPPAVVLVALVVGAVLVLLRDDLRSRRIGAGLIAVALLSLAAATLVARVSTTLPGGTKVYPWPGPAVAIATIAAIGAAMVAAQDLRARLAAMTFGARTVLIAAVAALCALTPLVLAVSWIARGTPAKAPSAVARRDIALLPPDVQADAAAQGDPGQRVLVLQRRGDGSLRYDLQRLSGPVLGDEDLRVPGRSKTLLDAAVRDLGAARGSDAAEVMTTFDVHIVVVSGRTRTPLTDALDSQPSLSRRDTPYDLSIWSITIPAARALVLPPALATSARAPAAPALGVGRGPARALLLASPPTLLKAGTVSVRSPVPAGPAGRMLVLSEARDGGWQASFDGHPLRAVRAWGWAQGWDLPARAGHLTITRAEGSRHTLDLLQVLALVVVLILASPTVGTDDETLGDAGEEEVRA